MNTPHAQILGLDVGGTKIAAGIVQFPQGRVLLEQARPTLSERGARAVLEETGALGEALAAQASAAGLQVCAVGLGLCELVDPQGSILSANCIDWTNDQVRKRLSHLGPVTIEADVRAAARAEALFGAGRPHRVFLYLTVGTGISACLMLEGAPYLGARGATGTLGSSSLSVPCEGCGQVNLRTLEEIASGPALVARLNRIAPGTAATAQEVLTAARAANPHAQWVARTAGEALGAVLGLVVGTLDPEAVVVGGGLGLATGPYWDAFVDSTRRHIWSDAQRALPILRAVTGPAAGFIGAAAAAWQAHSAREGSD
jgi:glucokinase